MGKVVIFSNHLLHFEKFTWVLDLLSILQHILCSLVKMMERSHLNQGGQWGESFFHLDRTWGRICNIWINFWMWMPFGRGGGMFKRWLEWNSLYPSNLLLLHAWEWMITQCWSIIITCKLYSKPKQHIKKEWFARIWDFWGEEIVECLNFNIRVWRVNKL